MVQKLRSWLPAVDILVKLKTNLNSQCCHGFREVLSFYEVIMQTPPLLWIFDCSYCLRTSPNFPNFLKLRWLFSSKSFNRNHVRTAKPQKRGVFQWAATSHRAFILLMADTTKMKTKRKMPMYVKYGALGSRTITEALDVYLKGFTSPEYSRRSVKLLGSSKPIVGNQKMFFV